MNLYRTKNRTTASNARIPKVRPRASPRLELDCEGVVVSGSFTGT